MPRGEECLYYDSKREEPVRYLRDTCTSFEWWVEGLVSGESWVAHWNDLGGSTKYEPFDEYGVSRLMGDTPPPQIAEMEVIAYASR